jgi:hypothetical protein
MMLGNLYRIIKTGRSLREETLPAQGRDPVFHHPRDGRARGDDAQNVKYRVLNRRLE